MRMCLRIPGNYYGMQGLHMRDGISWLQFGVYDQLENHYYVYNTVTVIHGP
jgi:hypothetical protein